MMRNVIFGVLISVLGLFLTSCGIVRPGEVGVKQRFGKIIGKERPPGMYFHNPFFSRINRVPVRTLNMQASLSSLPTKEGLSISCDLAVLFHIEPEYAVEIVETVGVSNGESIIRSVLRSATADVTAQFLAKDLHTAERAKIEDAIAKRMTDLLSDRGFVVEAVLLKSVNLPPQLSRAIEAKLEAEQQAQTMEFIIDRQRQEAERMKIEAQAIRDAQKIIAEGLNDLIIRYQSIEAFKELSKSNNTKVIVTDGKAPFLIDE
ncbi:MAG: prohibitin family protein [Bacteroidota bacterium]